MFDKYKKKAGTLENSFQIMTLIKKKKKQKVGRKGNQNQEFVVTISFE